MHNFPLDKAFQELDTYAVCTCDVIDSMSECHAALGEEPRPTLGSSVGTRELRAFLPRAWHPDPNQRPSAQECLDSLSVMEKPGLKLEQRREVKEEGHDEEGQ